MGSIWRHRFELLGAGMIALVLTFGAFPNLHRIARLGGAGAAAANGGVLQLSIGGATGSPAPQASGAGSQPSRSASPSRAPAVTPSVAAGMPAPPPPPPLPSGTAAPGAATGVAAATFSMIVDDYGQVDIGSTQIDYPSIHATAGGTGTYQDPITFATDATELKPGTIIYVIYLKRYFVMEDSCQECTDDWTKTTGPDGGPKVRRVDVWIADSGPNGSPAFTSCEDALANANAQVVVGPPANLPVDAAPLWNSKTQACYKPTA